MSDDDLDRRIAEGLDTVVSYVPRTAELVPEFHRRVARRRRRTTLGTVLALVVLAVAGTIVVGRHDEPRRAVTAGSTSTTARPPVTDTGLDIGPPLSPDDVRLPDEGIAVEVADVGVVLVGVDGRVYGHLPGLEILEDQDTAGPLLLWQHTDDPEAEDAFFLLEEGRLRTVELTDIHVSLPLSYGAELDLSMGAPQGITLRKGTKELFPTVSTMDTTVHVSNDRDIVSRDAWGGDGTNQAFDLRTGRVHDLGPGCWVADRHGKRWYQVCEDAGQHSSVRAENEGDGTSPVLLAESRPDPDGYWRKAMVSPDGTRLLLQWSGGCAGEELFSVPSGGGDLTPLLNEYGGITAEAYGWTADGHPVVYSRGERCGGQGSPPRPGIYVLGTDDALVYSVPRAADITRAAVWAPVLR